MRQLSSSRRTRGLGLLGRAIIDSLGHRQLIWSRYILRYGILMKPVHLCRRYRQFADAANDEQFRDALELTPVERVC